MQKEHSSHAIEQIRRFTLRILLSSQTKRKEEKKENTSAYRSKSSTPWVLLGHKIS